jgi:hypothetical protein
MTSSIFVTHLVVIIFDSYIGGEKGVMCYIDAFTNAHFGFWSVSIIVGISYVARHNLSSETKLTNKDVMTWIAGTCLFSLVIISMCLLVPTGGPSLDASGTFCFITSYSYVSTSIYFGLGFSMVYGILLYNLVHVYQSVYAAKMILKEHAVVGRANRLTSIWLESCYISSLGLMCAICLCWFFHFGSFFHRK